MAGIEIFQFVALLAGAVVLAVLAGDIISDDPSSLFSWVIGGVIAIMAAAALGIAITGYKDAASRATPPREAVWACTKHHVVKADTICDQYSRKSK